MQLSTKAPNISRRPVIGRLIAACKKFKIMIKPYIFAKIANTLYMRQVLMRTDSLFSILDKRIENLYVREANLEEKVARLNSELQVVADLKQEIIEQKRRLDLILAELKEHAALNFESVKTTSVQKEHLFDRPSFLFENGFRSSQDDIKKRQELYLPVLLETWERLKNRGGYVLDIECGKGELLESLRGIGIDARGVESNEDMVISSKKRGLIVEWADAITFLKGIKDDSLCGIFAARFVEHMTNDVLVEFIRLCFDKLQKGGKLVIETLNPESFYAMKKFYLDPSRQKPVHPQTISFFLEKKGFSHVEVKYLAPVPDVEKLDAAADQNLKKLNDFLFGFQEFAVIAQR